MSNGNELQIQSRHFCEIETMERHGDIEAEKAIEFKNEIMEKILKIIEKEKNENKRY